jgi:hypothetical protein
MSINHSHVATLSPNTGAWISFSYLQFVISLGMSALGVWFMPVDLTIKGYLAMALLFNVGATFTLAKTLRDEHEAKRLASRLDEARAERLLMEAERAE